MNIPQHTSTGCYMVRKTESIMQSCVNVEYDIKQVVILDMLVCLVSEESLWSILRIYLYSCSVKACPFVKKNSFTLMVSWCFIRWCWLSKVTWSTRNIVYYKISSLNSMPIITISMTCITTRIWVVSHAPINIITIARFFLLLLIDYQLVAVFFSVTVKLQNLHFFTLWYSFSLFQLTLIESLFDFPTMVAIYVEWYISSSISITYA